MISEDNTDGGFPMGDPLTWAAHYRRRAVECIALADNSCDPTIEAHYRFLAERYGKLAEAEEFIADRPGVLGGRHGSQVAWMCSISSPR